jgi:DNA polymerase-3 subunit epsilon
MPYAIVDIETTGGHASANGITEVAIYVHDGTQVLESYQTLINPGQPIPYYISGLTGITDAMVKDAPHFWEVADRIHELLKDNIFIAHSVNFDYSFIKSELANCGYDLTSNKLCTVRLSRKIFPGLDSYSLGKICGYLGIKIDNRHRADGDAAATVKLFEQLLANDQEKLITKFLKRNSKEQALPPNVPREHFERLPDLPGVYYFHDQKGKIVYVGKAKKIRKRVSSHFSNNSTARQKQDFMRAIHSITYELCGNELMALLLESHEIKRLWPEYNRSQKRYEPRYGIIEYTDQRGIIRLGVDKLKKGTSALAFFDNITECLSSLKAVVEGHELCPRLTAIATHEDSCAEAKCPCRSGNKKHIEAYNKKARPAIRTLMSGDTYVIIDDGRTSDESAFIVVEKGHFAGMGYKPSKEIIRNKVTLEHFRDLSRYRENFNIRSMLSKYVLENPHKVINLTPAYADH